MCKKYDLGGVFTYLGSAGIMLSSSQTQPPPTTSIEPMHLMQVSVPLIEVTLADITTLGGFCILVLRFALDICRERRLRHSKRSHWINDPFDNTSKDSHHKGP